ncbi:amidase [Cereibacter changlensis JA139]|uniref:Amidase n=2 Tax=Cereibacter changlensis TaxID=402884 RepID=A0A2T4JQ46_9RHOB|nr:amidase family protein [Cereibacter changlensis]PTE20055.1 amidase [Cereibacter changlensis JA139]PZX52196.1 aspartyl-tRNA(Asn)/glutamyl-tRNA(Gln) amidotransferase subunit A [Cereibacter changlensis]
MNWLYMTAADLGRGIADGSIHAVELTEAYLDAIAAHPEAGRIYARTTPDRARDEAMAAAERAKAGLRHGPLDGVPVSWKDLFDTAGVATEAGSALLEGRVPEADAAVLRTATAQGLVCLGKTHMSELAFSGLGLNPVTATPPCINDPAAVPGGSSSGAAASVAFGLAAAGIGSDTGGSVRIPSAWNDLVGLKTTPGRLSLEGVVPLAETFDTVGPLARSVEDCALLLAALEGGRAADLRGASLQGQRFLVLETVALDDLRDAPARGFDDAVTRLEAAGAVITRAKIPEVTEALSLAGILFTAEAYGIWGKTIETAPEKMFPRILERFRSGADFRASDYVAAWRRMHELRRIWAQKTAAYDAVLVPTSPILPPEAARLMTDDAYYVAENLLALRNTRIGNLFGLCGLSLPTGQPSCGISLMAGPGEEERLLRLGFAAERALG